MNYRGSCHCGRIAFEVEGDISKVMACNCSICQRKGALMWFVPRTALRLKTPEADMATYTFGGHTIRHHFCPVCGMHPFGEGIPPKSDQVMAAVNVRCLEGVEPESYPVQHFNGRAL